MHRQITKVKNIKVELEHRFGQLDRLELSGEDNAELLKITKRSIKKAILSTSALIDSLEQDQAIKRLAD